MLNKANILAASDLPLEVVKCPEWGGDVFIRTISGTERDSFEAGMIALKEKGVSNLDNIRARFLVRVLADDQGTRLFDDADAEALGKKSGAVLDRLFDVAQRVNGMGAKDVEELAKNS